MDFGDWSDSCVVVEDCWSALMKYGSLGVASPLLGLGVIFFIALRNSETVCLNFGDINYSIGVLIIFVIIQIVNFRR